MKDQQILSSFRQIRKRAHALGLNDDELSSLDTIDDLKAPRRPIGVILLYFLLACLFLSFCLIGTYALQWPVSRETILSFYYKTYEGIELEEVDCIVPLNEFVLDFARPPASCDICRGVTQIDRVSNLSPEEFEEKYAYTAKPVVIEDGQKNWTAAKTFSYEFFKSIYAEGSPALENAESNCQFFPYKTEFEKLAEVFNMSKERAQLKDGSKPWYIGWSNCDGAAAETLRNHYTRPYFLPAVAESSKTDWIFMGSPGHGANMHIDNVMNPSWQAQITGHKKWMLEAPPECYFECQGARHIETVLHPGDIIVVDTNVWVHGTSVMSNDISICIGSEFD